MNTLTGVDLDAAVASVLGEDHHVIQRCARMGLAFDPSHKMALAMELLIEHKIAIYHDDLAERTKCEPWVAGFDLRVEYAGCGDDTGLYGDHLEVDHGARGDTPQVAICRAIVQRAEDQVREAAEAVERAARQAKAQHETEVWYLAHSRAEHTRRTRVPWTDFANDEERDAYREALDSQLSHIRQVNNLPDPAAGAS